MHGLILLKMAPDFYQICRKKYLQAQKTRGTIYKFKE